MPEQDLTIKTSVQGDSQVKAAFKGIRDSVQGMVESARSFQDQMSRAGSQATSMSGSVNMLGMAFKAASSPLGLLAIGIGGAVTAMRMMNNEAINMFKELRELSAVTGLSMAATEDLKDTFELAGLSSDKLGFAMFRMSNLVEEGGKQFDHLGINVRKTDGTVKESGELFEEVRNKIASMGSSTEQSAAAMEIFSRAGRSLMPILKMSQAEYDGLRERAERMGSMTDELAGATQKLITQKAELNQQLEVARMRFANIITIPLEQTLLSWTNAATRFVASIQKFGVIGAAFIGKEQMQEILDAEAQADRLAGQAERKEKERADAATAAQAGKKRMLESDIKAALERGRIDDEVMTTRLKGEQAMFTELTKMRTGSDAAAIASGIEMNDRLIKMAEDRYQRERKLAEERVFKTGGGKLSEEEELKLQKDRDTAIVQLQQENAKQRLALVKSTQDQVVKITQQTIDAEKTAMQARLTVLESDKNRELAINEMSGQNRIQMLEKQFTIEKQYTAQTRQLKLDEIGREEQRLTTLQKSLAGNYEAQQQINKQLMDLQMQRVQAETTADQQVIQQRRQMVTELQNLANQEAGIGDALTNKAVENLKKRGRTRVSEADIMQEAAQIRTRGRETLGAAAGGGRVGIEQLQEAMSMRGTFGEMSKIGSSISGAIGTMFQQAMAAFGGQQAPGMPSMATPGMRAAAGGGGGAFMPTPGAGGQQIQLELQAYKSRLDLEMLQGMRAGAGAGQAASAIDKMAGDVGKAGDTSIQKLLDRMPDIMGQWFEKFTDEMIRKLEFEASRT